MKKILKSKIFLVIITIILSVGTTVCGAILYNANQVGYTPSDTTWNVNTVDEALNDLYNTANTKLNSTTATQEEILSGKVAYSRGSLVTGTMADNGAVNATIDPGASYTIPAGYHNGSGKVTANVKGGKIKKQLLQSYSFFWGNCQKLTYNASSINGYQNLTADNFVLEITSIVGSGSGQGSSGSYTGNYTLIYNPNTGSLSSTTNMTGIGGTWQRNL